jgi:FkbM family methyltransferase
MISLSKLMNRCRILTYLVENPILFKVYIKGGIINNFRNLSQPWFHDLGINTILDIGANTGQFAITISLILPDAKIYAFEPILDCFQELQKRMENLKNCTAINVGLGDMNTESEFEYNSFSPSSSFLKMTNQHKEIYPFTAESKTIILKLTTLDSFVENLLITEPLLVKIDVQGYEKKVLCGGEKTIKKAKLVIIENSFETLYEAQPSFNDIYNILVSWGFTYLGNIGQSHSPLTGKILQEDSIFIKTV